MKIEMKRWAGHVARMRERGDVYRILVRKPDGKRSFGKPRGRWENNIKMDLQEFGSGCMDWIDLARNRDRWMALVNVVMNLRVTKITGISRLAENRSASQEGLCSMV